jgi:cell division protein ZapA
MAQVTVQINGRGYQVACGEGEEQRIAGLAAYVDAKVQDLVGALGNIGDQRLIVMASLLLADEIMEMQEQAGGTGGGEGGARRSAALEALAERVERLAARLETS